MDFEYNMQSEQKEMMSTEEEISMKVSMALEHTMAIFQAEVIKNLPEVFVSQTMSEQEMMKDEETQITLLSENLSENLSDAPVMQDYDKFENTILLSDLSDTMQNVAEMIDFNEKFESEIGLEDNFILKMAKRASEIINEYDDENSVMIERAPTRKDKEFGE